MILLVLWIAQIIGWIALVASVGIFLGFISAVLQSYDL